MDIQSRFEKYHTDNPIVFDLFEKYARTVMKLGYEKYSAKAICERIRWHMHFDVKDTNFKLNNNYTSRYARLLASTNPVFADFFRNRNLRA